MEDLLKGSGLEEALGYGGSMGFAREHQSKIARYKALSPEEKAKVDANIAKRKAIIKEENEKAIRFTTPEEYEEYKAEKERRKREYEESKKKGVLEQVGDSLLGIARSIFGSGATHRENVLKRYNLEDKSYSLQELSKISKVPMKILQEVYNRGIGAARTQRDSVRLKGSYVKNVKAPRSAKLSDEQWAYARVFSFLDGNPKHDNDLRQNKEKVGGSYKSVAFVRKAMAKTKQENDGYRPPARSGYNFKKAQELDKPSKHIQMNIGEVPENEVVEYEYDRTKPSELTEEEKKRREVMKPEYWGLTFDDFEEVDGELVEKKHGLIWRPIYYKPARASKGCWGLRCCRYDAKGNTIPTNKKYEFIFFREDDDCEVADYPTNKLQKSYYEKYNKQRLQKVRADPPDEIENEIDGKKIVLKGQFAKEKTSKFEANDRGPFFYALSYKPDGGKRGIILPSRKTTYKDIPTIVSANNALRRMAQSYMYGKSPYGEERLRERMEVWEKRIDDSEEKEKQFRERRRKKGLFYSRRPKGKPLLNEKKEPVIDRDGYAMDKKGKRLGKVLKDFRGRPMKNEDGEILNEEGKPLFDITFNLIPYEPDGYKKGIALGQKELDKADTALTEGAARVSRYADAVGCNEMLIEELIKNPTGEGIDYKEIAEKAEAAGYGGEDGIDMEYTKEDVPSLMKEAKANLPKP